MPTGLPTSRWGPVHASHTGTVLTPIVLRTSDPDQGPGPTGVYTDPTRIEAGEVVTISADGTTIATSFPGTRSASLSTTGGTFTATMFAIGRDSYVIPHAGTVVSGPVTLTARATANNSTIGLGVGDFGPLLPAGSRPVSGTVLSEQLSGNSVISIAAQSVVLYDRDGVRDSNPGEEWLGRLSPFSGKEVLVTVQFRDGSFATVRGVQRTIFGPYGLGTRTTALESVALAGRSVSDVTRVLSSVDADHSLNWSELGFVG